MQKLSNGWYDVIISKKGNAKIVGLILIKHEFSFENEYIENSFQNDFSTPEGLGITTAKKGNEVFSLAGRSLFSLDFSGFVPSYDSWIFLLCILFFLAVFSFYVAIYHACSSVCWLKNRPVLFIVFFATDILLVRILQGVFNFPHALYTTTLFSPSYYSSSALLPSAGDYLLNSLILLLIAYVAFRKLFRERSFSGLRNRNILFSSATMVAFILAIYIIFCLRLVDLVNNSSFSMDLKDISKIGPQSLTGLFIVYCLSFCFYLFSKTAGSFTSFSSHRVRILVIAVATAGDLMLNLLWWDLFNSIILAILFAVFLFMLLFVFIEKTGNSPFKNIILPMIWMAILVSVVLNNANYIREREERKLIALKLATEKNPVTELLYNSLERKLLNDSSIHSMLREYEATKEEALVKYIKSNYIRDYWNRFTVQITVCAPGKMLRIQPRGYVFDCEQYFRQVCLKAGERTSNPNLYFIDYGTGIETYLAMLEPSDSTDSGKMPAEKIYIEFNAKTPVKDLGYPELLIDRRIMNIPDLSSYSYAMYQGGVLVYKTGKFSYPMRCNDLVNSSAYNAFFTSGGTDHYRYRMDRSRILVLSKKNDSFLGLISPVSYLFILFSLLTLVLNLVFKPEMFREFSFITLKNRFQIANVGIIIVSFLILGGLLLYFLIRLNNIKNMDSFSERTLSVMTEMQDKYGEKDKLEKLDNALVEEDLQRLSGMFYTDVNMYSSTGLMMLSSRPQIFDEGLISRRINPVAYADLKKNRQSAFFQDERIGLYNYTSAYFPLYNDKNELLAYINLPFFSRQEDLKKEINDFLIAFMNLYILFILISAFISVAISRYLSAPLGILVSRMEEFKLGKRNEKINWNNHDEIGRLVEEYNRLIDELAFSADQLARSERESAWREMARQVAHEIKNPLTPMKLSVQHLSKVWNDKADDFNLRLQRFTKIMTEQIDSLSAIATEFSDFAKMPLPFTEKLDLIEIINSVISMYSGLDNIQILLHTSEESAFVFGDKKQLVRIFTNLLNNATQAIGIKEHGLVKIKVQKNENQYNIDVEDNGNGITDEIAGKIFLPNFTTKSGGAGLGLAIVRGIIRSMGGDVKFVPGKDGAVFTLTIPLQYDAIPG
ncbi:MAG: HAMP domain-containing sensor histidine kinase [Bacteroidetes bacterium]|nr:HAMP domain-containing sensor histidine kinase [Bacteroidota bacterium]